MPALRHSVKRRPAWFLIAAAVALAAAAVFDWTRPPARQFSTYAWEHGVVGAYRVAVRPVVKHFVRCRFYPTCSHYSVQAVQGHGFPRGVWLTARRLVRCAPWTPMGTFDPVPPRILPQPSVKSAASHARGREMLAWRPFVDRPSQLLPSGAQTYRKNRE